VPTSGISAIDVEQPPSANADSNNAAIANALICRSTDIPTGNPTPLAKACWQKPAGMSLAATKRRQISPQSFKPLSPETIKA
jgi:hypothetical protein